MKIDYYTTDIEKAAASPPFLYIRTEVQVDEGLNHLVSVRRLIGNPSDLETTLTNKERLIGTNCTLVLCTLIPATRPHHRLVLTGRRNPGASAAGFCLGSRRTIVGSCLLHTVSSITFLNTDGISSDIRKDKNAGSCGNSAVTCVNLYTSRGKCLAKVQAIHLSLRQGFQPCKPSSCRYRGLTYAAI